MQCEDNSKLRTPLSEVCQTTDIGCVPITDGKPTCYPQPDELPFAFDPKTTTLWIFSCKNHEWINFTKFTMCQLDALNLDNITNICDILNIGVNYSGTGECKQGTITLAELVERIKECLKLETKIITIGEGDGNKIKISIEGLPNLPPVYVQGENIWSEGGSGTETDPLIVATYDPICKWPTKTQAQVDAATTKHLGACLDGEMSRIPFPPKVCELPAKNQAQVDVAQSVEVIACVDGQGSKIPYIKPSPPVCDSEQITLEQAKAKGTDLTLVGCDNSNVVRIPVSQSGFFDRDYICVPQVNGRPQEAPLSGTGPLRIGCNNELYVWLCEQNKWEAVSIGNNDLETFDPSQVVNPCENVKMIAWFDNASGGECIQNRAISLRQLSSILEQCESSNVCFVGMAQGEGCFQVSNITGVTNFNFYTGSFVKNEGGTAVTDFSTGFYHVKLVATNRYSVRSLLSVETHNIFSCMSFGDDTSCALGVKVAEGYIPTGNFDFSDGVNENSIITYAGNLQKNMYSGWFWPDTFNEGNIFATKNPIYKTFIEPGETKEINAVVYGLFGGTGRVWTHHRVKLYGYIYKGYSTNC